MYSHLLLISNDLYDKISTSYGKQNCHLLKLNSTKPTSDDLGNEANPWTQFLNKNNTDFKVLENS